MNRTAKTQGDPNPNRGKNKQSKQNDAEFLTEMFDYTPTRAAGQIAQSAEQAEGLKKRVETHQRQKDPLGDVPAPNSPHRPSAEKPRHHIQKDVLHRKPKA